ncbi:MAG: TIGR00266 family protein [Planctomycetota bacterium]
MEVHIANRPSAASATVRFDAGERLITESGAMIAMSDGMQVETTSRTRGGGMMKGLKRMLSGENFFLNHFSATRDGQEVILGPKLLGDIIGHNLQHGSLVVQGSSWLAAADGIDIDTTWQGLTSAMFSGEGMFWVKCSGQGQVLLNSFGGIYQVDVDGAYTVDTGHIVAFEDTLSFRLGKAGGSLIGSFLGGEGLVCKFSGTGRLWCQTHNPGTFGRLLGPKLKPR